MKINYGAMVNAENLYPVVYTVTQSGEKVFKPQYVKGGDLTEPQIKHLHDNGYFKSQKKGLYFNPLEHENCK